jgi:hypothetical protein
MCACHRRDTTRFQILIYVRQGSVQCHAGSTHTSLTIYLAGSQRAVLMVDLRFSNDPHIFKSNKLVHCFSYTQIWRLPIRLYTLSIKLQCILETLLSSCRMWTSWITTDLHILEVKLLRPIHGEFASRGCHRISHCELMRCDAYLRRASDTLDEGVSSEDKQYAIGQSCIMNLQNICVAKSGSHAHQS